MLGPQSMPAEEWAESKIVAVTIVENESFILSKLLMVRGRVVYELSITHNKYPVRWHKSWSYDK